MEVRGLDADGAADPADFDLVSRDLAALRRDRLASAVSAGPAARSRQATRSGRTGQLRRVTQLAPSPQCRGPRRRRYLAVSAAATLAGAAGRAGRPPGRLPLPAGAGRSARASARTLRSIASRAQDAGLGIDRPALDGSGRRPRGAASSHVNGCAGLLADDPLVGGRADLPADRRGRSRRGCPHERSGRPVRRRRAGPRAREAVRRDQGGAGGRSWNRLGHGSARRADGDDAGRGAGGAGRVRACQGALASIPDAPNGRSAAPGTPSAIGSTGTARCSTRTSPSAADLPAILGWDGPRRYLVLTQNPAELRPTGRLHRGATASSPSTEGRMTERSFRDIFLLDLPWDYPFIKPPTELVDYLLGPTQPWQLADANWSPDFPTSAQDAIRLYANESGDSRIDGVLGITTYTIDELLKVTGPIAVPSTERPSRPARRPSRRSSSRVSAGSPAETERPSCPRSPTSSSRPCSAYRPGDGATSSAEADTFQSQRLLLAWFKDPADQALGGPGRLRWRSPPGTRRLPLSGRFQRCTNLEDQRDRDPQHPQLDVEIDAVGNAREHAGCDLGEPGPDRRVGKPYRELQDLGALRILGMYFRLLVPERSRVESVSGGSFVRLTAPAFVGEEAGRTVIGAYLMVPPGSAGLRYSWTSPYVADIDETGGTTA